MHHPQANFRKHKTCKHVFSTYIYTLKYLLWTGMYCRASQIFIKNQIPAPKKGFRLQIKVTKTFETHTENISTRKFGSTPGQDTTQKTLKFRKNFKRLNRKHEDLLCYTVNSLYKFFMSQSIFFLLRLRNSYFNRQQYSL